jgi:RNA methyltransferase, TrmH family
MIAGNRLRLRRVDSRQNALVKDLRRAFQHSELVDGCCAIEGVRLIEEAIRSGLRFHSVFFAESAVSRLDRLAPQLSSHVELIGLSDHVFSSAVSTETPQGVAALVRWPKFSLEDALLRPSPLLLAAIGIQDPGNLGTMLRSAEAFGAGGIFIGERTVSEFNSKVIRSSAGSSFRVPTLHLKAAEVDELKQRDIRVLATSSHKGDPIDKLDLTRSSMVLIGSEGAGLGRDYQALADEFIRVPQSEKVESLNAGIAASVILYEAYRQRNS